MRNKILKLLWVVSGAVCFLHSCKTREEVRPAAPILDCGSRVVTGYTDKTSYYPGDELQVFLQSDTVMECALSVFGINGALAFKTNVPLILQTVSVDEPWKNGYGYTGNAKIELPPTLLSGVYLIENKVPFVVKSLSVSDVIVVFPVNTLNAYTSSGDKSLYANLSSFGIPSPTVSFLRPLNNATQMGYCVECLKWFPTLTDIQVGYISDLDLENYASITGKILIIAGHSEYWTRQARNNFDRHVDEGGHAIILSGNTMWWQVRYSADRTSVTCYKDAQVDPETNPLMKTILWADPSLQYPILSSIGADFNHGGYGLHSDNGWDGFKIFSPDSPMLEGAGLDKGDTLSLPTGEYDGAPISGFDADGFPILDSAALNCEKLELIGFDRGSRGGAETIPTFIVFQKTKTSGVVVNTGSNAWCSATGIGSAESGDKIKLITRNAIVKLLNGVDLFLH